MSAAARKRAKQAQGYEQHPPRCVNCQHYEPPVSAVPGKSLYRAPLCKTGGFAVSPGGICDRWLGRDGETLA